MELQYYVICSLVQVALINPSQSKRDRKVTKDWDENICFANNFNTIVRLYVNRGIRWRIPELKAHDLYVKEYEKRKQLFNGLLEYYCKDNRTTNDQILQFDECFNIAFNVDPDVTAFCRKKIFMFPGDVKEADCSDDDTREGEEFRACVTHKMMEKNPKFDLYDHAKTSKEKDNVELSKWLKKRSLKCLRRVFHMYLEDLQSEHDWPIWGNKFYYE